MEELKKVTAENAKALGQRLGLSKRQIFRLNSCGKLPAPFKIGGSVRWLSTEIETWLLSGCPDRQLWEEMKMQAEGEAR